MSVIERIEEDKGASAILVALSLVFLMGMAALAIDLGAGFNERRQSQTAADLSVMAGAMEIVQGGTQQDVVSEVLSYARLNLDTTYTDPEWQAMWQNCQDPDRLNFDVGIGTPVDFQPMAQPSSWGTGDLECISQVSSYLRVRIPDQVVKTSFARVIGFDQLSTHAFAIARLEGEAGTGGVLPFGIPGGTPNGEVCIRSGPSGTTLPPCKGPTSGGFGTILSEFFGDFYPPPSCANPQNADIAQNIAVGVDHALSEWPATDATAEGVVLGSPHPGDNVVRNYQNIGFDACKITGGAVVPEYAGHVTPPNAMLVDTGFSINDVARGLISNEMFQGQRSRLQQGANTKRTVIDKGNKFDLDSVGLWDYLTNDNVIVGPVYGADACDGGKYGGRPIAEKVARMHDCLAGYGASEKADIFTTAIADSPRFVWTPEYWHAGQNGKKWQPIRRFRLTFLAGIYLGCNGNSCDVIFYPDLETAGDGDLCASGGCNKQLNLQQITGFLLPPEAVPDVALPPYPGATSEFVPTLFK